MPFLADLIQEGFGVDPCQRKMCIIPPRQTALLLTPLVFSLTVACQVMPPTGWGDNQDSARVEMAQQFKFEGRVTRLAFSQGGRTLAIAGCQDGRATQDSTVCTQGMVQVWNVEQGALEATSRFPRAVTAITVSPDGRKWVAGDAAGRLIRSSVASKTLPRLLLHQKGEITALAFSPDGKWVASGSLDPAFPLGFMDMTTGGVIKVAQQFGPVSALAFSPESKDLAVGMTKGGLAVWSFTVSRSMPVKITANRDEGIAITSAAFSPDGQVLAYGRRDGAVVIWDRKAERAVVEFKGSSAVKAIAFSPDGRQLALGHDNGRVLVIESRQANPIWSKRHLLPVADMAYSPDGAALAVAVQRTVYLYRMEGTVSAPLATILAERQEGMKGIHGAGQASGISREAAAHPVSSRTLGDVLQIAHDEYMRLLPFDRMMIRAVEAMVETAPGSTVETQTDKLILTAGGRSMTLDLRPLRETSGRTGISQTVRAYETAQRFLLVSHQVSARNLENAAVERVLAELGPGVRVVPWQEGRGRGRDSTTDPGARVIAAAPWGRQEIIQTTFEGDVHYLKLPRFDQRTAGQVQVWIAGGTGSPEGAGAYLLDLRDNPGSELEPAVATAMSLLPKGHLITSVIARRNGDRTEYRSEGSTRPKGRLVVLVNERTAGTAEMLACAVRESGAGVLVGARTAGVDEVYTTFSLPDGSGLRISTGRFYCPGDHSLRWVGQPVDVEVSADGLGFSPRDYQVSPMTIIQPLRGDRQLRAGVGMARCLGQASQGIRVGARMNSQGSVVAALLAECATPLH